MPKLAQDYFYYQYDSSVSYQNKSIGNVHYLDVEKSRHSYNKSHKKHRKYNPVKTFTSLLVLLFFIFVIMPFGFSHITKQIFVPTPYKNITTDLKVLAFPSLKYLSNSLFMNESLFMYSADKKNAQMVEIDESVDMPALHSELVFLMKQYPQIKPAIYVWDYETENYVNINASKIYSTASIIKLPVLVDLFKTIESEGLSLSEKMPLTEYYRSEGSGNLQFKASESQWTIDELAKRMITISDNSATNMLVARLGSMEAINQSIRDWGLKNTEIKTWLPDLNGNNHTTAKEIGRILYNIDKNEKFLSKGSKRKIFDYMGHVHNDRLIQAGLGDGAKFLHKTGDIGSMLGDAGIVTTPAGRKYIVVILVNRPHNNPFASEFIVKASEVIYNYMVK